MTNSKNSLSVSGQRWLYIILLIGLAIRLTAAYVQPAFLDEAFVYYVTKAGPAQAISRLRIDTHPPTFNLLIYPLVCRIDSIFLLRLPTLLLSIFTLFLSFRLARRFYSETTSLAITAFMALSCNLWITDAQLRTYGPLTFCITIVWLGMLDIYQHGFPLAEWRLSHAWGWALWVLSGLTGACLHSEGAMVLAACALSALALPAQRWITFSCLVLEACPVSLWFIYNRLTVAFPKDEIQRSSLLNTWESFLASPLAIANWDIREWYSIIDSAMLRDLAGLISSCIALVLAILLWALFCKGWISFYRSKKWEACLLGISAVFAPLLICLAVCCGVINYTQSRYAIPLTLPFLITALYGLQTPSLKQLLGALLIPSLAVSLAFPFYPYLWNQNWQPTLNFIASIRQPNDIILVNGKSEFDYSLAMAYDIDNISYRFTDDFKAQLIQHPTPEKLPIAVLTKDMLGPELLHDLRGYRLIVVIGQKYALRDSYLALMNWLSQYYVLTAEFHQPSLKSWATVDTYVWERQPPQNN
ncbi:MAG: hypothetical protein Q4F00_12370 [bacterium]|nr:hypothetical protein [bacterium]